jgi:F-type H+-transporting ATPase subunit delta
MASRTQVAAYVADHLEQGRAEAIRSAAAWLMDHGQARGAEYLARDVAAVLAERGYVTVRVVTARPLSLGARQRIETYVREQTGAKELELETAVDAGLIGGVIIETPGRILDASVKTKLARFVEGVTNE